MALTPATAYVDHPVHAPYGNIARQALETAGLWPTVESKIIVAESVEQAFQYAEEGHVDAALVAVSVLPEEAVGRTVPVPEALYSVLSHELAVIEDAPNPSAARQSTPPAPEPTVTLDPSRSREALRNRERAGQ